MVEENDKILSWDMPKDEYIELVKELKEAIKILKDTQHYPSSKDTIIKIPIRFFKIYNIDYKPNITVKEFMDLVEKNEGHKSI